MDTTTNDDDQFQPPAPPTGIQISGDIMVTAIIVLFAVVFIMVLLHIYAQCYVHRRRRNNSTLIFHPSTPSIAGLHSTILNTLPVFTFSDDQNLLECAVCLSDFAAGETGRLLPKCKHAFHVDCIDMWFLSHSTCPLCRKLVDGESTQPESPASSRKRGDFAGVSVEVPARVASLGFPNSDESGSGSPAGQKSQSPASRLVSLKRILSRGKKPIMEPASAGTSRAEVVEMEEGRAESRSRASTPR